MPTDLARVVQLFSEKKEYHIETVTFGSNFSVFIYNKGACVYKAKESMN
jgi:hypothetical protein